MKYTPKSLYRVHRVAWSTYKDAWRGGFSPVISGRNVGKSAPTELNRQAVEEWINDIAVVHWFEEDKHFYKAARKSQNERTGKQRKD